MQTAKRILAGLLCLVIAFLAASCGRPQPTAGGTQTEKAIASQTQTPAAEDTTVSAEEAPSLSESTTAAQKKLVSLEPTQDDLDLLCETLQGCAFFGDGYDSATDNVLDFLYDGGLLFELLNFENLGVLVEGENLLRNQANPEEGRFLGKDDPLGFFKDESYVSVRADVLDAIMENVFCNTVYKSHTIYRNEEGKVGYYLYDGWYHFSWEISGYEGVFFRADEFEEADGRLIVTLNEYYLDPGDDEENAELLVSQAVDAVLRETDSGRGWSIYSIKNIYRNSDM